MLCPSRSWLRRSNLFPIWHRLSNRTWSLLRILHADLEVIRCDVIEIKMKLLLIVKQLDGIEDAPILRLLLCQSIRADTVQAPGAALVRYGI